MATRSTAARKKVARVLKTAAKKASPKKAATAVKTAAKKVVASAKKAAAKRAAPPVRKEGDTSPLKLPPIVESTTSSGLQVLAAQRGPLPLVAIRLTIRAGSATDPKDKQGIADFTSRLLRR